jgi:hypothetical protein
MPKSLEIEGFVFYFFSNESNEPPVIPMCEREMALERFG